MKEINSGFSNTADSHKSMSPFAIGCTTTLEVKRCITTETKYTNKTKIGSVNVANGETVKFSFSSGASVKVAGGLKVGSGGWSLSGTASLNTDVSTSVEYTIPGTCMIFWGVTECNLTRNIYANVEYLYTVTDVYSGYSGNFIGTEYRVTAIKLNGPAVSSSSDWEYNSNNSKNKASVQANSYGAWFAIYKNATATKKYSTERVFSGAFSLPVGFSGDVTTNYKSSHEIKWETSGNTTFYHYDNSTSGGSWFVTS